MLKNILLLVGLALCFHAEGQKGSYLETLEGHEMNCLCIASNNICPDTTLKDTCLSHFDTAPTLSCLFIPKAFAPNDLHNPNWYPVSPKDEVMEVHIVDDAGQVVYEYKGKKPSWDGTYLGRELPTATYTYQIDVADGSYTGTVHLLM